METIGSKLTPILVEIEETLLNFEANIGSKPNFSDDALRAATKIFCSVLMDKIYDLQQNENMDMRDRENMAFWAGCEIRNLIKNCTGIETHDFYREK